jgi:hypothetical protein
VTAVSIHRPALRLPKLLREPGGLALADALKLAAQYLDAASPGYLKVLAEGLTHVEALAATVSDVYDQPTLTALYNRSCNLIGVASVCGQPLIDDALYSLCDLLEHLRVRQMSDAEAVMVHVRALHLLIQHPGAAGLSGAQAILDGLHRVSDRYASEAMGSQ